MEQICPMVCKAGRNGGVERGCIKLLEEYQTFTRQQLIDELYRLNMTPYPAGNLSAYWDLYCRTLAVSHLLIEKSKTDRFDVVMVGGRWIQFHLGHQACVDIAMQITKTLYVGIVTAGYKNQWDRSMVDISEYKVVPSENERLSFVTSYLDRIGYTSYEVYQSDKAVEKIITDIDAFVGGADVFKDHALYAPQLLNPIRGKEGIRPWLSIVVPIQRDKDGKGYAVRRDDIK